MMNDLLVIFDDDMICRHVRIKGSRLGRCLASESMLKEMDRDIEYIDITVYRDQEPYHLIVNGSDGHTLSTAPGSRLQDVLDPLDHDLIRLLLKQGLLQ